VAGLSDEALHDIALSSSQAERAADEAERELMEWKKLKFMQDRLGEEFDALIVSVTKYGFFVELTELFIEGLVPLDSLEDDRYMFHENTRQIVGSRTRRTFSIGDRVTVLADRIDHAQRKIQFALVQDLVQEPVPHSHSAGKAGKEEPAQPSITSHPPATRQSATHSPAKAKKQRKKQPIRRKKRRG
jgi:ribonuclease R